METAGIIGVGRMGLAMVRHLRKGGFPVIVADLSAEAVDAATRLGATAAATAAAVAARADVIFVAVGFDDEAQAVCRGPDGIFAGARPGALVVVSSTVSPELVISLDRDAQARGLRLLDVPIARGAQAADEGTLLALVGGAEPDLERARPMLATFCSDIELVGGMGHGQVAKAMNNFLLWVNGVALTEAGRLAGGYGVDLPRLRDALMKSSGRSWALDNWTGVTFTWALKDMQVVLGMCDEKGLSIPLMGLIKEQVKMARQARRSGEIAWLREEEETRS